MGICNNCINNQDCVFKISHKNDSLMFCEEHEVEVKSKKIFGVIINYQKVTQPILDLCCNCDSRQSCTLKDAEKFIYQCEHYS